MKLFSALLLSTALLAPTAALANNGGGHSPVDDLGDGRGASCERGNASFCRGGAGGDGGDGGQGGRGGNGGNSTVRNRNNNRLNNRLNNRNNNRLSNRNNNRINNRNNNANTNHNSQHLTDNSYDLNYNINDNRNDNNNLNLQGQDQRQGQGQSQGQGQNQGQGQSQSADANQGQIQGQSSSNTNSNSNNGNHQNIVFEGDEREVPIAPLLERDSVGVIGDIAVPLPVISATGFASSRPDNTTDYGVSFGVRIPLGTGAFRDAANEERQRRADRGQFQLIAEAVWLRDKGVLNEDAHPRHYRALYGNK